MDQKKRDVRKGIIVLYILITAVFLCLCGGYFIIDTYYPLKYEDLVSKYADAHGMEREFVCAVIATESKFSTNTKSGKGAVGLMQIMPQTAEWVGGKLGIDDVSEESLKDPETNIRIGTWYLKFLLDRYENADTAAAAYNAGHGNVDKWLANKDYSDDGETLKDIPFEETKKYVKKVKRAYEIYKKIYSLY